MTRCGRPTRSGDPCKQQVNPGQRACQKHSTPEDTAFYEGYRQGWGAAADAHQGDFSSGFEEGRKQAERAQLRDNQPRDFTDGTGRQLVEVDGYAYAWCGEDQLSVGDKVIIPENWLTKIKYGAGDFEGTVNRLGITYTGELSEIIRQVR
jgi:hypothetical protein